MGLPGKATLVYAVCTDILLLCECLLEAFQWVDLLESPSLPHDIGTHTTVSVEIQVM